MKRSAVALSVVAIFLALLWLPSCSTTVKKKPETYAEVHSTNPDYPANLSWNEIKSANAYLDVIEDAMHQRNAYFIDIANYPLKPDLNMLANGGHWFGCGSSRSPSYPRMISGQAIITLEITAPRGEQIKPGTYPFDGASCNRNSQDKSLSYAGILFADSTNSVKTADIATGHVEVTSYDGNAIRGKFIFSGTDTTMTGEFNSPIAFKGLR